jgi:tetratricopeptide (TPR) repeat protein
LYRRALALHALGKSKEALLDVKHLLAIDAGNIQALKLCEKFGVDVQFLQLGSAFGEMSFDSMKERAKVLLAEGRPAEVITLLQSLSSSDMSELVSSQFLLQSDLTTLLHLLSAAHSLLGDYLSIIGCCDNILKVDPVNFKALLNRGQAHRSVAVKVVQVIFFYFFSFNNCHIVLQNYLSVDAPRLHLAVEDAVAALKLDPSSRVASVLLEDAQAELRHYLLEQSIVTVDDASDQRRLMSDAVKERGNHAMTLKDFTGAFQLYSEALGMDASNTSALNNRALALLKLERFSEAVDDCSEVIRRVGSVTHSCVKALARRAEAYRGLSQTAVSVSPTSQELLTLAVTDLDSILVLDPSNQAAKTKKLMFLASMSQTTHAQSELNNIGSSSNQSCEFKERSSKKIALATAQHETLTPLKSLGAVITTPVSARATRESRAFGVASPLSAVPATPPKNSYELLSLIV